ELRETKAAEGVLRRSLELYPSDPLTNLNLARAMMQKEKPAEARPFLERALSTNPFDPEVQARLFEVAKALGDEALTQRAARAVALLVGRDAGAAGKPSPMDEE
ncbi:MAG TPA: tetratricopeptide repeat protein, partial [Vulgatibacter sp.]